MSQTVVVQLMYLALDKSKCQVKTADNKFFPFESNFGSGVAGNLNCENLDYGNLGILYDIIWEGGNIRGVICCPLEEEGEHQRGKGWVSVFH